MKRPYMAFAAVYIYFSETSGYTGRMINTTSWPVSPTANGSLVLHRIWRVEANRSYQVRRSPGEQRSGLVALRTLQGQGTLSIAGQEPFVLGKGSLLLLASRAIERYGCAGAAWRFWWFEFEPASSMPVPLDRVLAIPAYPGEAGQCGECFETLRRGPAEAALASSMLGTMLHRWALSIPPAERLGVQQLAVERAIAAMRRHVGVPISIEELADQAHWSVRQFRNVFRQITGQSPKRFYDSLRIRWAAELLRTGLHTVAQVADQLGYSSPFHLSRAFKAHLGSAPTRYLRRP